MRDHLGQGRPIWDEALDWAERRTSEVTIWEVQNMGQVATGLSGWEMGSELYNFTSQWISDDLYSTREVVGKGTGFGLCCKLYSEYQGGDQLVRQAGKLRFLSFPRCDDPKKLEAHIDGWEL